MNREYARRYENQTSSVIDVSHSTVLKINYIAPTVFDQETSWKNAFFKRVTKKNQNSQLFFVLCL